MKKRRKTPKPVFAALASNIAVLPNGGMLSIVGSRLSRRAGKMVSVYLWSDHVERFIDGMPILGVNDFRCALRRPATEVECARYKQAEALTDIIGELMKIRNPLQYTSDNHYKKARSND